MQKPDIKKLALYLEEKGFSGNIAINEGPKNWRAIQKLVKHDKFYTFGINDIDKNVIAKKMSASQVRDVIIDASGLDVARFRKKGAGYFDPEKSAKALIKGIKEIDVAAKAGKSFVFATGHPGAMVGLLEVLANHAAKKGGKIIRLKKAVKVKDPYYLDMIGPVMVPSDGCSAWHSHESAFMESLLGRAHDVDFVVADHGFVGAALNHGISCVGFYDTDDPAMPLAEFLGLPVTAVPINDNNFNANSAELARFVLQLTQKL